MRIKMLSTKRFFPRAGCKGRYLTDGCPRVFYEKKIYEVPDYISHFFSNSFPPSCINLQDEDASIYRLSNANHYRK